MGQKQFDSLGDLIEFNDEDMRSEDSLYAVQHPETIPRRITFVLFEEIVESSPMRAREVVFDPEANPKDRELLVSVQEHGVITPIVVRELSQSEPGGDGSLCFQKRGKRTFALVAGHRRVEAGKAAGLKGAEGVVTRSSEDHELLTLVENMGRRKLTSYEQALALKTLQDRRELSGRQVANVTGISKTHVHRLFNALRAPAALKELWREGELDATSLVELKKYWRQFSSKDPTWLGPRMREMSRSDIRELRDQLGAGIPLRTALNVQDSLSNTASPGESETSPQEDQAGGRHYAPDEVPDVDDSSKAPAGEESLSEGLECDVVAAITDVFPIKGGQAEALFDDAVSGEVQDKDVLWAAALYVAHGGEVDQAFSLAAEALSISWMGSVLRRETKQMKQVARRLATCQHKELKRFMLTIFSPLNE